MCYHVIIFLIFLEGVKMSNINIQTALEQSYKSAIDAKLNETYEKYKSGKLNTFVVNDGYFLAKLDKVIEQQKKAG